MSEKNITPGYERTPELRNHQGMARIRRWSYLLDKAFRIPGTRMRFGWDAIVGLMPGLGDAVTALFSLSLLVQAFRIRIPGVVRVRMFINVIIDLLVGAIPVLGDLFDFAWKANSRNLELLERHATGIAEPTAADWVFVAGSVAFVVLLVTLPLFALAAVVDALLPGWSSPISWRLLLGVAGL